MTTVTIIAAGSMGAAVGRRLVEYGVKILTSLAGRSAATIERGREAGFAEVTGAGLVAADFILSIVPPGQAIALAEELAPMLRAAARKPVYVDCNAVNPATVAKVAAIIGETGADFVDAGIIGAPPRGGYDPVFYASGPPARRFLELRDHGLDIRVLDDKIGTASALKMSYAGITKGLTAVGTAMLLAASRAGVADALRAELASSQPMLLEAFTRSIPSMYPRAYRWVAEMREIGGFAGDDEDADTIYRGIANLYGALADDVEHGNEKTAALDRFLAGAK